MTNPRPAPKVCKCGVYRPCDEIPKGFWDYEDVSIDYCPLHANAERLVDALEKAKTMIVDEHVHEECDSDWCLPLEFAGELRDLLRECKGETK